MAKNSSKKAPELIEPQEILWGLQAIEQQLADAKQRRWLMNELRLPVLKQDYHALLKKDTEILTTLTLQATLKNKDPENNRIAIEASLNRLTYFVLGDILKEKDLDLRTVVLERYIQIMLIAYHNGDYLTVSGIYNALNDANLRKLKVTFEGLSANAISTLQQINDQLHKVFYALNTLKAKEVMELMGTTRQSAAILYRIKLESPLSKAITQQQPQSKRFDEKARLLVASEEKLTRSTMMDELKDFINESVTVKYLPVIEILANRQPKTDLDLLDLMIARADLMNKEIAKLSRNIDILNSMT